MVNIRDVFEVHAPRQRHGSTGSGEGQRAGIGGLAPTDTADIHRVGGAGHQTAEFVEGVVGDNDAVGRGTIGPAHDVGVCRAGIGPGKGSTVSGDIRHFKSGRTVAAADGVHHHAVDVAGDGGGAGAGLHDGDAVAVAGVAAEFHLKLVPTDDGRGEGGQTGESGGVGHVFADTNSDTHLVHIGGAATIFVEETYFQGVHISRKLRQISHGVFFDGTGSSFGVHLE